MLEVIKNLYAELFTDLDYKKWLRLVIIVGGYILIRNLAQRELAKRKLASQLKADEKLKIKNNTKQYLEDPEDVSQSKAVTSSFGWGNRTRQRVKQQEKAFEEAVEKLKEQQEREAKYGIGADEDADIQDLLED